MKFKKVLVEAFSPSMPEWLKQYLLVNPTGDKTSKYADWSYIKFNNPRDLGRDKKHGGVTAKEVIRGTNSQGTLTGSPVDLSRATFITAPVPKLDDPILYDPNKMCFVHLESDNDETVWIPGRSSESEKFVRNNGATVALSPKYLNNKILKEAGVDFCYIDLTDPSSFTKDLRDTRDANKKGAQTRRHRNSKNKWSFDAAVGWGDIDKSGNTRVPAVDRYADELRRIHAKKLPDKLIQTRELLIKLQKDISDCMFQFSDLNADALDTAGIEDALKQSTEVLMEQIKKLKEVNTKVESYVDHVKKGYRYWADSEYVEIKDGLNEITNTVTEAYNYLSRYLPSEIDWDVPYIDVEDDFE